MTPLTVFVRTLMKTSAIFIGATVVFLHPSLEWSRTRGLTAQQGPADAIIDALTGALKDSDAGVRRQAAVSLGQMDNARAVPALIEALKDAEPGVKQRAIVALGQLGDARAAAGLAATLKDASPDIRARAASALGELQDRSAVEPLIAAARDANADVRRRVAQALGNLSDDRALQGADGAAQGRGHRCSPGGGPGNRRSVGWERRPVVHPRRTSATEPDAQSQSQSEPEPAPARQCGALR
jgi:hypothetical protein